MATLFFGEMITRGLAYRNDGPDLADAKLQMYVRMLMKYPPDAARAACDKKRPDGWLPSADKIECEIIDMIGWRLEVFEALVAGEVITEEEKFKRRERLLGLKVWELYNSLPFWDTGTPRCRKAREDGLIALPKAIAALIDHAGPSHDYQREVKLANEWIEAEFIPYPYGPKTDADREAERQEGEARKLAAVREFEAALDRDLISEHAGRWPFGPGA